MDNDFPGIEQDVNPAPVAETLQGVCRFFDKHGWFWLSAILGRITDVVKS